MALGCIDVERLACVDGMGTHTSLVPATPARR
jgi:hypothetical protein